MGVKYVMTDNHYDTMCCLNCKLDECNQSRVGECVVNGVDADFNINIYHRLGHGIGKADIEKAFFRDKTLSILKFFEDAKLAVRDGDYWRAKF